MSVKNFTARFDNLTMFLRIFIIFIRILLLHPRYFCQEVRRIPGFFHLGHWSKMAKTKVLGFNSRIYAGQLQEIENKNLKIQNWKLELSGYHFDVEYRPGKLNLAADALTRNFNAKKNYGHVNSLTIQDNLLEKLHKEIGYPGITR